MQVIVAPHAGACYGVNRALDIVNSCADDGKGPVYTLGPLIHNPQVVDELRSRGVEVAGSPEDVEPRARLVIRSHGVPPAVVEHARDRGCEVIDATCPHVAKVHRAVERMTADGRLCIVVGDVGHPEVEGILGHAGPGTLALTSAEDLPDELPDRVGIVVQTPQAPAVLARIVDAVSKRVSDLEVADTICLATQERQAAAAELASQVDVMVVIGGRNSGNTRRLHEICSASCPRSFHIEREDELVPDWFEGMGKVGITAGASTPQQRIDAVLYRIEEMTG